MTPPLLLVGGLGEPHDRLVAAALEAEGHPARAVGALDEEAHARGRAALPRGQCAPILYTTGALLRAVERLERAPARWLSPRSCGPCRYALFEPAWARALAAAGRADVEIVPVDQSIASVGTLLGLAGLGRVLDALVAADALRELVNRLRPHVEDPDALEARAADAAAALERAIAAGDPPIAALAAESGFHRTLTRRPAAPLARVQLVGDPWSLHVDGDGQLNLPRALGRAGAEVLQPPFALWIDYLAWQLRSAPFGAGEDPSPLAVEAARGLEARLRERLGLAAAAAGMTRIDLPDQDALAALAAPHLPPDLRGGYGHVEVGLALRARLERRAHLVVSVKSFGCVPSSGVSDAVVPTLLGPELSFLAVEVASDGEAARESRLMLRVASALDAAADELARACATTGADPARLRAPDPLADALEPRPYACTLACHAASHAASGSPARAAGAMAGPAMGGGAT